MSMSLVNENNLDFMIRLHYIATLWEEQGEEKEEEEEEIQPVQPLHIFSYHSPSATAGPLW